MRNSPHDIVHGVALIKYYFVRSVGHNQTFTKINTRVMMRLDYVLKFERTF